MNYNNELKLISESIFNIVDKGTRRRKKDLLKYLEYQIIILKNNLKGGAK